MRKAGQELRVDPSALSRALDHLERALGVRLLDRSPVGVRPTAAGEDFLRHARAVLDAAGRATDAMRAYGGGKRLKAGLIAGRLSAAELTEPILLRARADLPELTLDAKVITTFGDEIRSVVEGSVDVAIIRGPLHHPDLDVVPLALEPRAVLVSRDCALAQEDEVDVADLINHPTVRLAATRDWAQFWQLDDSRPAPAYDGKSRPARNVAEMQTAVAGGHAIVSTSPAVERIAIDEQTRCVGLRGVPPSTIAVAFRADDRRPEVRQFVDSALAAVNENIALLPGGLLVPSLA